MGAYTIGEPVTQQLGFLLLALGLITSSTVALCTGHITSDQWLSITGASGVVGGGLHYLTASSGA